MRICHIASGDIWAGAEAQVAILLGTLSQRQDVEVSAVLLNEGQLAQRLRQIGLRVEVIEEQRHGFRDILQRTEDCLSGAPVDIVHSHRYKENVLAGILKRRAVVSHVVQTVHGLGEPFHGLRRAKMAFYLSLNRYFTRKYFDRVFAVSHDVETSLHSWLDRDRVTTIHNAIDLDRIAVLRSPAEIRRELEISEGDVLIGTAGRLVPVKGFSILQEAARRILSEHPKSTIVVVGDGPLRKKLERDAGRLGIDQRMRFIGFREDALDILNALDIFVLSSHHEGIPTVLLEAMALEKAVVATRVGGVPEVLEHGDSGLLVPPGEPSAFAEACLSLIRDLDRRRRMASAARQRVTAEFASQIQAQRTLAAYQDVLDAG